jgi:hypothetical protein
MAMRADPGTGDEEAPIGSVAWAQFVRLDCQSIVKDLPKVPARAHQIFALIKEHRAWTLMNRPDGSFFATFEDFCVAAQPWGLGTPFETVVPYLEAAVGKRALSLVTVAPDARGFRERDAAGAFTGGNQRGHDGPNGKAARSEKRLRSVLRAPEPVQDLYRAGLIGQVEAAKLGPRDPEPAQAARIVEVARAAQAVASAKPATTPREKKQVQREVNKVVRAQLGVAKPAPLGASGLDYNRVTSAVMVMASEQLVSLRNIINGVLKSRGLA